VKSSNGTVLSIPALLLSMRTTLQPYTFADTIKNLSEPEIVKEQMFDGEICYVISAKAVPDPWLFWIGKTTLLLRKMRSYTSFDSFDEPHRRGQPKAVVTEEVHRQIRIDGKIPEEIFHYKPKMLARDEDLTK